ncbi:MAG: M60 family metallopeptidase [Phycisphaeraceae bacterium]|nr:hypothetical protein [Phycisphaerae bacterium]MBX3392324.1 M60 family metallopeptidase [Phycisphaeraceae bacterium]
MAISTLAATTLLMVNLGFVTVPVRAALLPGQEVAQRRGLAGDPREALLDGVGRIAAPGVPGTISVWGAEGSVIVAGIEGGGEVPVVATSRLGLGGVVLFAHSGYLGKDALHHADTGRLMARAVRWSASKETPRVGIVGATECGEYLSAEGFTVVALGDRWHARLEDADVIILAGDVREEQFENVRAFLRAGGGFITAQTGWGWRQIHRGRPVGELGVNRLLEPASIAFTDGYADRTAADGFDAGREVSPYAHGRAALLATLEARVLTAADARTASHAAMSAVRAMPRSDAELRPRIDQRLAERADQLVPTESEPMTATGSPIDRFLLAVQVDRIENLPADQVRAHPAASRFPGPVPSDAPRLDRVVPINTAVSRWHSLGLYVPAGEVVTVEIPESAAALGLRAVIGCHTDELWHHGEWKRVPRISSTTPLSRSQTTLASSFGGLLYIDVPARASGRVLDVTVRGAVAAPLFVLGKTSPTQWRDSIRHAPGPWAELATSSVIVSIPSEKIRDMDDPTPVLEFWNRVMDAAADLAEIPRERQSPERFVPDVQISAGYMHSGYPIMTHLDAADWLGNLDELRQGNWGLYHELGHNHQHSDWTFDGTVEVTCNLFTLYIHDMVCDRPRTDSRRWLEKHTPDAARHLARGARFETWKREPFTALAMYMQLQQAFGWETFKKVFAEYRDLPSADRPKGDDQKRDQWLVRFSRACGRNLGPFFESWGVPTSQAARDQVLDLPGWMPEGWPP